MASWTIDELNRVASAEELQLASLQSDGTLRKRVTVWVVRAGDELYIRSWRGNSSAWFRGTQVANSGRIWAGGLQKDVTFVEETNPEINDRVDAAYRAKYGYYPASFVDPMVAKPAKETTIRLVPRLASP
jgi:hypothetical protein